MGRVNYPKGELWDGLPLVTISVAICLYAVLFRDFDHTFRDSGFVILNFSEGTGTP